MASKFTKSALILAMLLMMACLVIPQTSACESGGGGGDCRGCIMERLKFGCPSCATPLRCMARCLWGGSSRSVCVKKCDCGGGKKKLSSCKKCMSKCRCHCVA